MDLIKPRACLFIANKEQLQPLEEMKKEIPDLQFQTAAEVSARIPILPAEKMHGGLYDERGGDLDVDAVLQAYLRLFRRRGGKLELGQDVSQMQYRNGNWFIQTARGV